jgi:hypothetical protein
LMGVSVEVMEEVEVVEVVEGLIDRRTGTK